eukprot:SM000305S11803  [mRNA]  locus=s305:126683:130090:+ [translate_table: standard]
MAATRKRQRWMALDGDRVAFPGGGSQFRRGAGLYLRHLGELLRVHHKDDWAKSGIRTALDVGCGVASFAAHLLSHNVITMSFAPHDTDEYQVQFALERGLPAVVGRLGGHRLPYPSLSFDLAHCSRCMVHWAERGGVALLEVHRLLRPGGYFVWSAPPVHGPGHPAKRPHDRQIWKQVKDLTVRMCWRVVARREHTIVWQKPLNNTCYSRRRLGISPSICDWDTIKADSAGREPLLPCLMAMPEPLEILHKWPARLHALPPRLASLGITEAEWHDDGAAWKARVNEYWSLLSPTIFSDGPKRPGDDDPPLPHNQVRNCMDINAGLGGFAAAMVGTRRPLWVLSVAPSPGPNALSLVFERGLLGVTHNWFEPFPTYPRTYDLLHAAGLLSRDAARCGIMSLTLEMDRILRPEGWVIMRDSWEFIEEARAAAQAVRWEARVIAIEEEDDQCIMIAQKILWRPP